MNFLQPGEELQNLLCEAEYFPEQQGIVLVPVTDIWRVLTLTKITLMRISGVQKPLIFFSTYLFQVIISIILRHEVLCNCRASTMLNPWEKRDSHCLKRTVDVIAIFL